MEQRLKITVAGKGDEITPDTFAEIIRETMEMLRAIDASITPLHQPTLKWKILEISMNSPCQMTIEANPANPDVHPTNAVTWFARGMQQIETVAEPPEHFDEPTLGVAKKLASHLLNGVASLLYDVPGIEQIRPSGRIVNHVDQIVQKREREGYLAQGTLEGYLRRITVDPSTSTFQLVDRLTNDHIECTFTRGLAHEIGAHVSDRVVVTGRVTYGWNGRPKRVSVQHYDVLKPVNELKDIEDLHNLGLNITDGRDAADYIDEMRNAD